MIAVQCCEKCGAPYEVVQKFRGPVALPTCTCHEDATFKRVDAMIERIQHQKDEP